MFQVILFIFLWFVVASAAYAGLSAAPWVPTKSKQKKRLVESVPLKDGDRVYDLGCGTGTLLFAAAEKNPKIKAVGFELSILPYLVAKLKKMIFSARYKNVEIRYGNLFKQPLNKADVIFVFLLSRAYPRLRAKFARELKNEALVAIEGWPFPQIEAAKILRDDKLLPIFVYQGIQFKKLI